MRTTIQGNRKIRAGLKDCWNAFMLEGAEFTDNDIPICPTILSEYPKEILTWVEAKEIHKKWCVKIRTIIMTHSSVSTSMTNVLTDQDQAYGSFRGWQCE